MSKIAGKRTKRYPRFRSEIGDISLNLFPQVAGGFALLPYAATLCGTQRTENLRLEIAFRLLQTTSMHSSGSSAVSSRVAYVRACAHSDFTMPMGKLCARSGRRNSSWFVPPRYNLQQTRIRCVIFPELGGCKVSQCDKRYYRNGYHAGNEGHHG